MFKTQKGFRFFPNQKKLYFRQNENLMINKTVKNVSEACADIKDGATIMFGGFGLCGIPENCK